MFHIAYASSATKLFTKAELHELLVASRVRNEAAQISGMLLYKDGNFLQVIEGEEAAVRSLYRRIERDPRHGGSVVLQDGFTETRIFGEWSMAFREVGTSAMISSPGFSEFLNEDWTTPAFRIDPSRCEKLLLNFRRRM